MQFQPKTKQEIDEMGLWPVDDLYTFKVLEKVVFGNGNAIFTEEKLSKKGTPMIQMVVQVFNSHGKDMTIKDYIMSSYPTKLFALCEALGLMEEYHRGDLTPAHLIGKGAFCKLKIETDDTGTKRNRIADYFLQNPVKATDSKSAATPPAYFDDIPFE